MYVKKIFKAMYVTWKYLTTLAMYVKWKYQER